MIKIFFITILLSFYSVAMADYPWPQGNVFKAKLVKTIEYLDGEVDEPRTQSREAEHGSNLLRGKHVFLEFYLNDARNLMIIRRDNLVDDLECPFDGEFFVCLIVSQSPRFEVRKYIIPIIAPNSNQVIGVSEISEGLPIQNNLRGGKVHTERYYSLL